MLSEVTIQSNASGLESPVEAKRPVPRPHSVEERARRISTLLSPSILARDFSSEAPSARTSAPLFERTAASDDSDAQFGADVNDDSVSRPSRKNKSRRVTASQDDLQALLGMIDEDDEHNSSSGGSSSSSSPPSGGSRRDGAATSSAAATSIDTPELQVAARNVASLVEEAPSGDDDSSSSSGDAVSASEMDAASSAAAASSSSNSSSNDVTAPVELDGSSSGARLTLDQLDTSALMAPSSTSALDTSVSHGLNASMVRGHHWHKTPGRSILISSRKGGLAGAAGGGGGSAENPLGASMTGRRRGVIFGSPQAALFDHEAPASELTSMDKSQAKTHFKLGPPELGFPSLEEEDGGEHDGTPASKAATAGGGGADDDGQSVSSVESFETSLNSSILAGWEKEADRMNTSEAERKAAKSRRRKSHASSSGKKSARFADGSDEDDEDDEETAAAAAASSAKRARRDSSISHATRLEMQAALAGLEEDDDAAAAAAVTSNNASIGDDADTQPVDMGSAADVVSMAEGFMASVQQQVEEGSDEAMSSSTPPETPPPPQPSASKAVASPGVFVRRANSTGDIKVSIDLRAAGLINSPGSAIKAAAAAALAAISPVESMGSDGSGAANNQSTAATAANTSTASAPSSARGSIAKSIAGMFASMELPPGTRFDDDLDDVIASAMGGQEAGALYDDGEVVLNKKPTAGRGGAAKASSSSQVTMDQTAIVTSMGETSVRSARSSRKISAASPSPARSGKRSRRSSATSAGARGSVDDDVTRDLGSLSSLMQEEEEGCDGSGAGNDDVTRDLGSLSSLMAEEGILRGTAACASSSSSSADLTEPLAEAPPTPSRRSASKTPKSPASAAKKSASISSASEGPATPSRTRSSTPTRLEALRRSPRFAPQPAPEQQVAAPEQSPGEADHDEEAASEVGDSFPAAAAAVYSLPAPAAPTAVAPAMRLSGPVVKDQYSLSPSGTSTGAGASRRAAERSRRMTSVGLPIFSRPKATPLPAAAAPTPAPPAAASASTAAPHQLVAETPAPSAAAAAAAADRRDSIASAASSVATSDRTASSAIMDRLYREMGFPVDSDRKAKKAAATLTAPAAAAAAPASVPSALPFQTPASDDSGFGAGMSVIQAKGSIIGSLRMHAGLAADDVTMQLPGSLASLMDLENETKGDDGSSPMAELPAAAVVGAESINMSLGSPSGDVTTSLPPSLGALINGETKGRPVIVPAPVATHDSMAVEPDASLVGEATDMSLSASMLATDNDDVTASTNITANATGHVSIDSLVALPSATPALKGQMTSLAPASTATSGSIVRPTNVSVAAEANSSVALTHHPEDFSVLDASMAVLDGSYMNRSSSAAATGGAMGLMPQMQATGGMTAVAEDDEASMQVHPASSETMVEGVNTSGDSTGSDSSVRTADVTRDELEQLQALGITPRREQTQPRPDVAEAAAPVPASAVAPAATVPAPPRGSVTAALRARLLAAQSSTTSGMPPATVAPATAPSSSSAAPTAPSTPPQSAQSAIAAAIATPGRARALIEKAIARSARKQASAAAAATIFTPRHGAPATGALAAILRAEPERLTFSRFCELAGLHFRSDAAAAASEADEQSAGAGAGSSSSAEQPVDDSFRGGLSPGGTFGRILSKQAGAAGGKKGGSRRKSSIMLLARESSVDSAAEAMMSAQKRLLSRTRNALLGFALLGREHDFMTQSCEILQSFVEKGAPQLEAAIGQAIGSSSSSSPEQPFIFGAVWRAQEILSTYALEGTASGIDEGVAAEAEALLQRVAELKAFRQAEARAEYLNWRVGITQAMEQALGQQAGQLREESARLAQESEGVNSLINDVMSARLKLANQRETAAALVTVAPELLEAVSRANAAKAARDAGAGKAAGVQARLRDATAKRDALRDAITTERAALEAESTAASAAIQAEAAKRAAGQPDHELARANAAMTAAHDKYVAASATSGWRVETHAPASSSGGSGAATLAYRHPDGSVHLVTVAIARGVATGITSVEHSTASAGAGSAAWAASAAGGIGAYYAWASRAIGSAALVTSAAGAGGAVQVRMKSAATAFKALEAFCARVHQLRHAPSAPALMPRFTPAKFAGDGAAAESWALCIDVTLLAKRLQARVTADISDAWGLPALAAGLSPSFACKWLIKAQSICGPAASALQLQRGASAAMAQAQASTPAAMLGALVAACEEQVARL